MKQLVAYYSRTGTTKKAAEAVSKILKCDIDEIIDTKNRKGIVGYVMSGREATLGKPAVIKKPRKNPALYDLVIIGTPVWAYNMSSPVRAYLLQNKGKFRKVAFFCTMGGSGGKTFRNMAELCSKKPVAVLELKTEEVVKGKYSQKLREFTNKL